MASRHDILYKQVMFLNKRCQERVVRGHSTNLQAGRRLEAPADLLEAQAGRLVHKCDCILPDLRGRAIAARHQRTLLLRCLERLIPRWAARGTCAPDISHRWWRAGKLDTWQTRASISLKLNLNLNLNLNPAEVGPDFF